MAGPSGGLEIRDFDGSSACEPRRLAKMCGISGSFAANPAGGFGFIDRLSGTDRRGSISASSRRMDRPRAGHVPNKITSKHNMRYVPEMDGLDLVKKVRAQLDKNGYKDVELKVIGDVPWSKMAYDTDIAGAITQT